MKYTHAKHYRDDSIILLFAQRRNIGVKLIVVIETGMILKLRTSDFIFGSRANVTLFCERLR
jgi:hypothetical protein